MRYLFAFTPIKLCLEEKRFVENPKFPDPSSTTITAVRKLLYVPKENMGKLDFIKIKSVHQGHHQESEKTAHPLEKIFANVYLTRDLHSGYIKKFYHSIIKRHT